MPQITQQELQTIRHLIGAHETAAQKLRTYAQQCNDSQIKQMFEQSARSAENTKNKLMTFLS